MVPVVCVSVLLFCHAIISDCGIMTSEFVLLGVPGAYFSLCSVNVVWSVPWVQPG